MKVGLQLPSFSAPGWPGSIARAQLDEGIEHAIVNMPGVYDPRCLDLLAREVIPAVSAF